MIKTFKIFKTAANDRCAMGRRHLLILSAEHLVKRAAFVPAAPAIIDRKGPDHRQEENPIGDEKPG